jgi:hypothetical protein
MFAISWFCIGAPKLAVLLLLDGTGKFCKAVPDKRAVVPGVGRKAGDAGDLRHEPQALESRIE